MISEDAPLPTLELIVSFKSANLAGQVKVADEAGAEPTLATAEVILVPRDNESPLSNQSHGKHATLSTFPLNLQDE